MAILKGKRKIVIPGIIVVVLILGGVIPALVFSNSGSDSESVSENQTATVQRGNLSIDIAASGNLSLSHTEDLVIDLFYGESGGAGTKGTVGEVLVEEGDTVEEGQVLVTVDASEWEDNLEALENQIVTEERDILQAKINLKNAQMSLENAMEPLYSNQGNLVTGVDPLDVEIKELQVKLAQSRLEDAEKALEEAEEELAEALEMSPEITAPFDGFVIQVNVEGGDEVLSGTVAVVIADPDKFEAEILVSEMDISQINLGGEATVEMDAMQGLSIPAEVTHISPTATIQSGVVNYTVKVELQPLEEIILEQQEAMQEARQEAMQDIEQGELPEPLKQALADGLITQEQVDEMMSQMQQWEQQGQGPVQGQATVTTLENFQLREGLTVTVSLIAEERNDVLLVPSAAIITRGLQTYVQVLSPDGMIEDRAIQTGITDYQFTEVTDGLSEGEQVIIPQGTTTTTTTTDQPSGPPRGGMMIPMGGPPG